MATLTKADLTEYLFENLGLNKQEAKALIETFFEEICETLERGETVKLAKFGNFKVRDKKPRIGRNPKTGKPAEITARRVVTFRAGQKFKGKVKNYGRLSEEGDNLA